MGRLVGAARRRSGQGGFTLVVVMTAIAVFSIVVVALLGMVLTDLSVQRIARVGPASDRSVDGALDAAVNQLKITPGGSIGRQGEACNPVGTATGTHTDTGDVPYSIQIDTTLVEITCIPKDPTDAGAPLPSTSGTALTLLGGYTRPLDVASGAADQDAGSAVGNALSGAIADAATTLITQIDSASPGPPGLIHLGPQPLNVLGDVKAGRWALGLNSTGHAPAFNFTGSFTSGRAGPFAVTNHPCGVLDPTYPNLPDLGLRIAATGGMTCNTPAAPGLTDPLWAAPFDWSAAAIAAADHPALDADCSPVNGVVTLHPGYYDATRTAVLNSWFSTGVCDNVTFLFSPGDYFFDVIGGDLASRSALKLADSTSNWVFGTPMGWDPALGRAPSAAFPAACDTAADGVSITLSGRTTIQHQRGLAAFCNRRDPDGHQLVLIYQQALPDLVRWGAVPTAATSAVNRGSPAFATPGDAAASVSPADTNFPTYGGTWNGSEGTTPAQRLFAKETCSATAASCNPAITFTGFSNPDAPAPGGNASDMRLWIQASRSSNIGCSTECSFTDLSILTTDGRQCNLSTKALAITAPLVPNGLYGYDLGGCRGQGIVEATQLEGATITLLPQLRRAGCLGSGCTAMTFSVDYVWLDATTNAPSSPSAFSTQVNASPSANRSATFYGPIYLPRSQVEVNWQGGASSAPIFSGGLVARSVASWPTSNSVSVGVLASPGSQPPQRRVLVLAKVGDRLRGSAIVTLTDANAAGTAAESGRLMQVEDWRLCSEPWTVGRTTPCPSP